MFTPCFSSWKLTLTRNILILSLPQGPLGCSSCMHQGLRRKGDFFKSSLRAKLINSIRACGRRYWCASQNKGKSIRLGPHRGLKVGTDVRGPLASETGISIVVPLVWEVLLRR
ncbi:hypothetical protein F5144DRAFT_587461 [Chaetomium tenue]|uniref:Uncharacterized protein n=1 Tax=Chaetomium tenue TaxID=1854479 RepID=A0ACB7NVM5_9PEZI|nr:hypothetical protein F5144DRAFT_587461 [Chaetomium globosum]